MASPDKDISSQDLMNSFNEGVLVLDSACRILFASSVFLELTGFQSQDVIGQPIDIIFNGDANGLKFISQGSDRKASGKLYTEILTKKGTCIPVRISISDNSNSKEPQYFVFIKDGRHYRRIRKDILRKAVAIERLSKSRKIRDGKIGEAIFEILQMASRALNTERVNAWLFNENHSEIECIGNFDAAENKMVEQERLARIFMPHYFRLFETEMIITSSDAFNDPMASELFDSYLKPNRIHSLMDIPLRIEGEIIGVVCFEHRNTSRVWNLQEQKFALVIAQMISLALETSAKQKARNELEIALNDQKVLLKEVHHRVKNNLAIISSLLNLQSNKARDDHHKNLFMEARNRIDSIAAVHHLLYQSKSFSSVNFQQYLEEILGNLHASFSSPNKSIRIEKEVEMVELEVSIAIPLALIVNEMVTNAYKHAFENVKEGVIGIFLKEINGEVRLTVRDNGPGYDAQKVAESAVGLDIINGLVDQIDGVLSYHYDEGAVHEIIFSRS